MLFKILEYIRSKPKQQRDQYAFGIALFCTLAIGGLWSLSLPSRFAGDSQVAALASTTNAAPFTNFFTQLKSQFSGIKESLEVPPATHTAPRTTASSTEAALDLQLTDETKDQINQTTTTEQGTTIRFGAGATTASGTNEYAQSVIVASSTEDDMNVRP